MIDARFDDLVAGAEQFFHEIAADKAGGAGDEDLHSWTVVSC